MELKLIMDNYTEIKLPRLNRTFYGIETRQRVDGTGEDGGLNRTFYGIETTRAHHLLAIRLVLIVPFMELKLRR